VLVLLNRELDMKMPDLEKANEGLASIIRSEERRTEIPRGWFCCGKCSVALWRNLTVGGMPSIEGQLAGAGKVLKQHRDGNGGWNRFPFYYTLSALIEMDLKVVGAELKYAVNRMNQLLPRVRSNSRFGERRKGILKRALDLA